MLILELELEEIMQQLEKDIAATKGDEEALNNLLRIETMTEFKNESEIETKGEPERKNSLEVLINYLRQSPSYGQLRDNMDKVLKPIKKEELPYKDTEALVAKLLVAVMGDQESLNYFAPILKRYEDCIKIHHSEASAENKALSFFSLFLVNNIIWERAIIKTERKKDGNKKRAFYKNMRKSSSGSLKNKDMNKDIISTDQKNSSKDSKNDDAQITKNPNIIRLATIIQKRVATKQPETQSNPSFSSRQIDDTLILLNKIFRLGISPHQSLMPTLAESGAKG